jgi:phytoene synthase
MQLTNIARDIFEDASHNRIYLPQEAFSSSISDGNILLNENLHQLLDVRETVLKMADLYYSSADRGMHFLPLASRLAIIIVPRLYQAKGKTIRKDPVKYFKRRADVHFLRKVYQTRTLRFFCTDFLLPQSEIKHNASLHLDLHYLPAVDSPAG